MFQRLSCPGNVPPHHSRAETLVFFLCVLALLLAWPVKAEPGSVDLRAATWGEGHIHRLDGDWLWVPGQWLSAAELQALPAQTRQYMRVPGFWNEGDAPQPQFGHATLALRLETFGAHSLYLQLSDVATAYRLYINDRPLAQVGIPGQGPETEQPMFHPVVVRFDVSDGSHWIILHLSNHHYKQIGVRRSIQLTDESGRLWLREIPQLFDIFFCGVLLTLGSLSITRFFRQRRELASLYLGLFSLMVGTRALLVGERILYQLEWFSWSALQKAEHIFVYAGLAAFAGYLYELMDGGVPRRFVNILLGTSGLMIALTLFLPVHLGTLTIIPFKLLVLAAALYIVFAYWPMLRARGAGVFWFGTSFACLLGTLVIDLLSQNTQLQNRPVVHWGMVLFVVCQGLFLNQVRQWRRQRLLEGNEAGAESGAGTSTEDSPEPGADGLNRHKLEQLEWQMQQLRADLLSTRQITSVPAALETTPLSGGPPETPFLQAEPEAALDIRQREALVSLLRNTLGLWERFSHKSKVQLAEESRCWRVYIDGTTVKTRTFDKYLKSATLPQKPRWRLVIRTAYYVLEHGNLPDASKSELDQQITATQVLFSHMGADQ